MTFSVCYTLLYTCCFVLNIKRDKIFFEILFSLIRNLQIEQSIDRRMLQLECNRMFSNVTSEIYKYIRKKRYIQATVLANPQHKSREVHYCFHDIFFTS